MLHISVHNEAIPYKIVRSNRQTVSIEVSIQGEVLVRVPHRLGNSEVHKLVESKGEWIARKRWEMLRQKPSVQKVYKDGMELWYLGQQFQLKIKRQNSDANVVRIGEGELLLELPMDSEVDIKQILIAWYYRQAANEIEKRVKFYASRMGVTYHRISIKDQKTRWGSCSSKGNLNFNFRLIMAPADVIDYVVVHELCHRKHMNHSELFWKAVEEVIPEYRKSKEWLKQYGAQLRI